MASTPQKQQGYSKGYGTVQVKRDWEMWQLKAGGILDRFLRQNQALEGQEQMRMKPTDCDQHNFLTQDAYEGRRWMDADRRNSLTPKFWSDF